MSRYERRSLMKPAIRVANRNQYNRKRRWAEEGSAGLDARRYFGVHVFEFEIPRVYLYGLQPSWGSYVRNTHAMQVVVVVVVVVVGKNGSFLFFSQTTLPKVPTHWPRPTRPTVVVVASAQRSPEEGVSDDGRTTTSRFSWGERGASLPGRRRAGRRRVEATRHPVGSSGTRRTVSELGVAVFFAVFLQTTVLRHKVFVVRVYLGRPTVTEKQ